VLDEISSREPDQGYRLVYDAVERLRFVIEVGYSQSLPSLVAAALDYFGANIGVCGVLLVKFYQRRQNGTVAMLIVLAVRGQGIVRMVSFGTCALCDDIAESVRPLHIYPVVGGHGDPPAVESFVGPADAADPVLFRIPGGLLFPEVPHTRDEVLARMPGHVLSVDVLQLPAVVDVPVFTIDIDLASLRRQHLSAL